jgi:hypothetical protein
MKTLKKRILFAVLALVTVLGSGLVSPVLADSPAPMPPSPWLAPAANDPLPPPPPPWIYT